MRFKRHMFLTLILLLTIFSLSFAAASEIGTYEQNAGELESLSMSDLNPIDANLNNVNVNSVDESNDNSADKTGGLVDEIKTDDCLTRIFLVLVI